MSDTSVKIPVSELRIGMYVSKLDRDWLDTPFLIQGFFIESSQDVATVASFCEHVWVDAAQNSPPKAQTPRICSVDAMRAIRLYSKSIKNPQGFLAKRETSLKAC
jgi:hypothetical protein